MGLLGLQRPKNQILIERIAVLIELVYTLSFNILFVSFNLKYIIICSLISKTIYMKSKILHGYLVLVCKMFVLVLIKNNIQKIDNDNLHSSTRFASRYDSFYFTIFRSQSNAGAPPCFTGKSKKAYISCFNFYVNFRYFITGLQGFEYINAFLISMMVFMYLLVLLRYLFRLL